MAVIKNKKTARGKEFWNHVESISSQMPPQLVCEDEESTFEDYLKDLLRMAANELIGRGAEQNPSSEALINEIFDAITQNGHNY